MRTHPISADTGDTCTTPTCGTGTNCGAPRTLRLQDAEIALLQMKQYAAVVVWRSMLREAKRTQRWQICRTAAEIGNETGLSRNTIFNLISRRV